jgi:FkbM family methyltransferase
MKYKVLQVGSFVGDTTNDYIFNGLNINDNAIFIEPVFEYFERLKNNYNTKYPNNNFTFLNIACSDKKGKIKLYKPIKTESVQEWVDQLTSVLEFHTINHNVNAQVEEIEVDSNTLENIITEYNITDLDILSVDTEGHDYEILSVFDFKKLKPKKIIFEHKHIDGTNKTFGLKYYKLINYFFSLGYFLDKQTEDDTYLILKNG